jgi:hypothetical protein
VGCVAGSVREVTEAVIAVSPGQETLLNPGAKWSSSFPGMGL